MQRLKHIPTLLCLLSALAALVFLGLTQQTARASGGAYFILSPSSSTHTVGDTFTVTVYEYSQASDNVEGVQADLSYSANLQCNSVSESGTPFTYLGQSTCSGGSVKVGEAAGSTVSGQQLVATISLTALSAGTASVNIVNDSNTDIKDSSNNSVWNGVDTSGSYTLNTPTPPPSGGGSTGGSTTKKSTTKTNTPPKPTTTPTTTPTAPTATTTPSSQTNKSSTSSPQKGSLSITVTGSNGKPLANAHVELDNYYSEITNKQGKAGFSGIAAGNHTVKVTASGKNPTQESVMLSANQTKNVSVKLASATSMLWLYITLPAILVLAGGGYGFYAIRLRPRVPRIQPPIMTGAGGVNNPPLPPTMPSVTVVPTQPPPPPAAVPAPPVDQPPTVTPGPPNHPLSF